MELSSGCVPSVLATALKNQEKSNIRLTKNTQETQRDTATALNQTTQHLLNCVLPKIVGEALIER